MNTTPRIPSDPLSLDLQAAEKRILELIKAVFLALKRDIALIGLSGGLDSSLTAALTVRSLGKGVVRAYYLPDRDSNPGHRADAWMLADRLGLDLQEVPLTRALRALGVYQLLPLGWIPGRFLKARVVSWGRERFLAERDPDLLNLRLEGSGGRWVRRGNAYATTKHRLRAAVLYREAERLNGMVVGAANRTEWLTGTFTQWGCDHCADLMPILHLFRSQVEELAEYLGLPREILEKPADPDLLPGLPDKGALLGSFQVADQILWALERGYPVPELSQRFGEKQVEVLSRLMANSAPYREAPYSLL